MAVDTQIVDLAIDQLQPNPLQPRGVISPESLVDLIDSIKEHGILEPLVIAKTPAGYQIIAGERRWRAAKYAGLPRVPVVVKETTPQGMLELALVENVQRVDLNALDRAKGFERLISEFGLSNSDIAQRVGKSTAYVSNTMRLLKLPDALKDGLLSGLITEGHARALSAIEDEGTMIEAYKVLLRESGSVRRAEDLARRMKIKIGEPKRAGANISTPIIINEETDNMVADIQNALSDPTGEKKTFVRMLRSRSETKLYIVLKGKLYETEERVKKIHKVLSSLKFSAPPEAVQNPA